MAVALAKLSPAEKIIFGVGLLVAGVLVLLFAWERLRHCGSCITRGSWYIVLRGNLASRPP